MNKPFFTSARERRLWLYTTLVMIAIYTTLGLARPWFLFLEERGLVELLFSLGMLFVMAAIVTQGFKSRVGGVELAAGLGITAVYLLLFARITIPAERTHLIEYSIVALLVFEALLERQGSGSKRLDTALLALMITAVLGWVDESIQALLPNRVYAHFDVFFNLLAAFIAISGSLIINYLRGWWANHWNHPT